MNRVRKQREKLDGSLSYPQWKAINPIAAMLVERRSFLGLTQLQLATRARVSICTIRNIEQGYSLPGNSVKQRLALALKIPSAELWGVAGPFVDITNPVQVFRIRNKLTRTGFARQLGISRHTLIKVEQGNLYLQGATYEKIADHLGISGRQLIAQIRESKV